MYIAGPDGASYGYCNDHSPVNIHSAMDAALKRYRAHPPAHVQVADADLRAPFAVTAPAAVSVARVFARITPVPKGCTSLNQAIGRDYLWIYPSEVRAMLAAGCSKVPASLALRLARFHLLDDVRGTPDLWQLCEVRAINMPARVTRTADGATVDFTGRFELRTKSGKRGYGGVVEGRFELRASDATAHRVRIYASGQAFGDGTYTPNAPKGKYTLSIAIVEATDKVARTVPPEAVSTENSDRIYRDPTLASVNL